MVTDSKRPQEQHERDEATAAILCPSSSYCRNAASFTIWKESQHDEQTATTTGSEISKDKTEPTTTTTKNESGASYGISGSMNIQTPVRKILELGIVPDCGTPPLWLNDTLGNKNVRTPTKANMIPKYATTALNDVEERIKTPKSLTKTEWGEESTPRTSKAKTSALAAAFLKKVDQSWKQDVVQLSKHVPSLRIVKSVKGRWPPQAKLKASCTTKDGIKAQTKSPTSLIDITTTVSTKELLDAFEKGNFRQTTDLSPKAIKEAASNRAREESLLSPVSVKQRQRSFENHGTTPLHKLYQRTNRLCQSDHAITTSGHGVVAASTHLDDHDIDDDSTLSSHTGESTNIRSSYKIQYLGQREWGNGYVDSTFPTLVRRLVDESEVFPEDIETCNSGQYLSRKGKSHLCDGGNLVRCSNDYDRRFEYSPKVDLIAKGVPMTDRRFDVSSSADTSMPAIPNRTRDVFIPTIWQTRASGSVDGDSAGGKWRLKRVWEHSQNTSIVIDDGEPDYLVDDSDLESALNSLLGIYICFDTNRSVDLNSVITPSVSNMSEFSHLQLAKNRWGTPDDNKDPLLKKPWRIQRVWDRDGVICHVDDEKTLDGASLLELFSKDDNVAKDRNVVDGPQKGLLDPDQDHREDSTRLNDNKVIHNCHSRVEDGHDSETGSYVSSDDDGVVYIENDPLNEEDFEASLDMASTTSHDEESDRSLKLIRRKLRKVEKWIQKLQDEKDGKKKYTKLYLRLQQKCVQYLNDLSHRLEVLDREQRQTLGSNTTDSVPGKISVSTHPRRQGRCSDEDYEDVARYKSRSVQDVDSTNVCEAKQHRSNNRDHLRKKQTLNQVSEETSSNRTKAIDPVDSSLELNPVCSNKRSKSSVSSSSDTSVCTSLQSMLGNLKNLDVIIEDEDSGGSIEEDRRDIDLLRRKIRKVKKEMQKIVNKTGEKGKNSKLYLRLKEKLAQYQSENSGTDTHLQNCPRHKKGQGWMRVRKRVEEAIGVMQLTLDESGDEKEREETQFSREKWNATPIMEKNPSPSLVMGRLPSLACSHAGRWSSPLATGDDDMKLTIHSLESVYR